MTNIDHFKQKLEDERRTVLRELSEVGRINPDDKTDWEPIAAERSGSTAEIEERATEISDFEDRSAIEFELEQRLGRINEALAMISAGTYGICSVCKNTIEPERLEANPAATTCKAHK